MYKCVTRALHALSLTTFVLPGLALAGSTKTQASLPSEDAVLLLLYGLLRSGQIVLRRIDGRNHMPKPKTQLKAAYDETKRIAI